ncbi:MAG TPA: bifunctional diguanylate cyclase/phosphodiesterase [Pseudonocardia sp.]
MREPDALDDAVARADLFRSRQAAFGSAHHPEAMAFAENVARAIAVPSGGTAVGALPLPDAAAVVCDRSGLIMASNPAFHRMTGAAGDADLFGMRLSQILTGPDSDARLVRADGQAVGVAVVRFGPLVDELSVVAFVGRDDPASTEGRVDRTWAAELERLARVGTWSFDLATGVVARSDTLEELYVACGLDPAADLERRQIDALRAALRAGAANPDDHAQLHLPGDVLLSCRAEVERAADGTPVRIVGVVRDVTSTHDGMQRFVDLMKLMPDGVAVLDAAGRLVDVNPGLCALLGASAGQLRGMAARMLAVEPPHGELPSWLRPVPPGARYGYRVDGAPLLRADGTTIWCALDVAATPGEDGERRWLVVVTDMSERRRAAELLRRAGTVDELTRLPNRTACLELVDRLLAGPGRDRVAVVCGGLDDFQRINSSLGHEAGDDLLVTLAGRLQRDLPVGCDPARLSGDEFVVICADHAEVGGPDRLAELVADLLRTEITVHGRPVHMTASVGLATPVPSGDVRAADLLRFAEAAMLDAKRTQHRGGIAVATDGVVRLATRALELEAELQAAIAAGALVLEYQPVVGPDGRVLSLEALVRWPHPERGLIPPADFLPVAQRSGLLRELDRWVLRTAAAEAATWPEHEGVVPAVAVNLAGLLPGEVDFAAEVGEAVQAAGLPWDRLVLELVETSLVALPPHALAAMACLAERGVRFAVDDFGTGYSSLARLKELPAQTVKIDRAFVTGIAADPVDFAVARAVVDMAHAMGRETVAEGVETAEQFHVLRGIGVDAYQGWLFSRPLPADQVAALLEAGRLHTPADAGL